jgi:putative oxidoreductase
MERFLGRYSSCLYATLRIIAGLMFALHGSQKLFAWPGGDVPKPLASLMGVAGLVELIGGLLIAFGLLTSYAAFIASGQMAVAYFRAHAPQGALPLLNRGELAVLYCFLFLYIASQGAGGWSLDAVMRRKR